ncbi:hypothetical protein CC1G_01284 [Coprinopsis cinerea okayama7|uniref:Uncharacterized protein n=1 Tax=Coprinopsis cinerea (strain Okayama-7 / 130 / ATCC MYA-4618 / FGSC 9003) TaxID=240176 RepID=A8NY89_COPC7|nr:hypothetical protein CC1G_01284 [Coprinopsis cinerea okayama7\|eukprot:XP_001837372.2 hypothetical protein CC1G_01284 [Coprinopsis cinerea okayama7\
MNNDPASVKALLEQLRVSQAWQQLHSTQQQQPTPSSAQQPAEAHPPITTNPQPTSSSSNTVSRVAELLAQLKNPPSSSGPPLEQPPTKIYDRPPLRKEQANLERQLWADREGIHQKYNDKVKVAQTKASMIGGSISQHEATMLQDAYRRELSKYDRERVLPAWDGLVMRQQAKLESLKVPNMFISADPKDRQRQVQIVQVLLGLAGGAEAT